MESSLYKLAMANASPLPSPIFPPRHLIAPLSPSSYFQNLPWIMTSRDPDHLRSSGQLSGWTWSNASWPVKFAVSALFWRIGIGNFSEDVGSGRTCALNWTNHQWLDLGSGRTCALNWTNHQWLVSLGHALSPRPVSSSIRSIWLSPVLVSFWATSPSPAPGQVHSLDREEGTMRRVRGSDREKTRWNDKNTGLLEKSISSVQLLSRV